VTGPSKIKSIQSGGPPAYSECEWAQPLILDDCGNTITPRIECHREDLWFWVEKEEQGKYGPLVYDICLPCAVREGMITEEEIKDFGDVPWRRYLQGKREPERVEIP
jgi:hypothetical protein